MYIYLSKRSFKSIKEYILNGDKQMSNLTQEQISEIQKSLKESIDLFYNKLEQKFMLRIRDLEQEIDIIRSEISKLRRELQNKGVL